MNNEPVAWAYIKDGEFWDAIHPDEHAQEEGSYTIPLYTHPVKELNRELLDKTIIDQQNEIKDLRKNLDVALMIVNKTELTDEEIRQCILEYFESPEYNQYPLPVVSVKFARAILRKAQEK